MCKFKITKFSRVEHPSYGYVRYSVKASYKLPLAVELTETEVFHVMPNLNLKNFASLAEPVKNTEVKSFGNFLCKSGPVQVTMILPKTGFLLGETIPITIEVDNESNIHIKKVTVKLKEKLIFSTQILNMPKTEINKIQQHKFKADVGPFKKEIFQTEFFVDPSYSWKTMHRCERVKCKYYLETNAAPKGWLSGLMSETDITIGTIGFDVNDREARLSTL